MRRGFSDAQREAANLRLVGLKASLLDLEREIDAVFSRKARIRGLLNHAAVAIEELRAELTEPKGSKEI